MVPSLTWVTAYHTSLTMDQHIAWGSQDLSRHPQFESDVCSRRNLPVSDKEDSTGGNIHRQGRKFLIIRGKSHG
jgi:hypothetical protein